MGITDIKSGDCRTITVNVTKSSDSSVYDLTSCSINLYVRKLGGTTNVISKAGTITDATAGIAEFDLVSTDTTQTAGTYKYDVVVTNATKDYTVYSDTFNILENISG